MSQPNRRQLLAAAPGLVLFAAGCPKGSGGLGQVGKALKQFLPKVRFDRVKLRNINFKKADLTFLFQVDNPAPLKVALSSFSYALSLEGSALFEGDNANGVTLKPEATAPLRFPMTLKWADLSQLLKDTKGKDKLGFGLSGHMGFNTPVGEARLPYDAAGEVPALRRPRFALQDIKLTEFKPMENRARVAINLGVTNLGGSAFSFKGFDYKLKLGGNRVASGVMDILGDVAANSTQRLSLPVDLSLTGVGAGILDAFANKGKVNAQLGAGLMVGTPFGDVPLSIDKTGRVAIS